MSSPTIFSRILLVVSALAVVGLTYWFIATSLAPVTVPPNPPARGAVKFDPQADVTTQPIFASLQPLGPQLVARTDLGRPNPFVPAPPAPVVTSTVPIELPPPVVTSTPAEIPVELPVPVIIP